MLARHRAQRGYCRPFGHNCRYKNNIKPLILLVTPTGIEPVFQP